MSKDLLPYGSRVLVKLDPPQTETKSGIVLPGSKEKEQVEGTVVHVGSGERDMTGAYWSPLVVAGDRIMFNKFSGVEWKNGDDNFLLIADRDILAVIVET